MNGTSTTRISLLEVLRDQRGDDAAWGEFVRVYGPAVVTWCRERGLQHDDALDVTQDVLLRFWQTSKKFAYDPRGRFRSYHRGGPALMARCLIDASITLASLAQTARPHQLSAYDAVYLDIAISLDLPLFTDDHNLRTAADRMGVTVIEPQNG